jgi:aspartate carbamoyltransferase catalytic subunit
MDTIERPQNDISIKHVLSVLDLVEPERLSWLFEKAKFYKNELGVIRNSPDPNPFWKGLLAHRIVATIFFEPSTRTRLSFESAALRLGASVIGTENAEQFSSAFKGERTRHSGRIISGSADVIILRHNKEGEVAEFAKKSLVPVINAGDGKGEHPTQALLDLFTIWTEVPRARHNRLKISIVGDLKNGRTARSLCLALARLQNSGLLGVTDLRLVSPPDFRMGKDVQAILYQCRVSFVEFHNLTRDAVEDCDIIYMTRPQLERMDNKGHIRQFENMVLDHERLSRFISNQCRILHPLPCNDELPEIWDDDLRSRYFIQADNGIPVRMALLQQLILGAN